MPAPNRVILLTPPGAAAIAVVRLSGERVGQFLAARFSRRVSANRAVHGNLTDESGSVLDDAVVVFSRSGTVADVNLHGGPWVVQSVLELARRVEQVLERTIGEDASRSNRFRWRSRGSPCVRCSRSRARGNSLRPSSSAKF
jgi:tRNA U34 5-carboxymethylaminomethyl modifying GTPase MnmE/TrmE